VEKTIGTDLGENGRNGEVRGIRLDNRIVLGLEVAKDGGRGECILEPLEGSLGCIVELELDILLEKAGQGDDDPGVALDKTPIEVGKTKEGLDIMDRLRFGPTSDSLDLVGCHGNAIGRDDITKKLDGGFVELAFLGLGVKSISSKTLQDLTHMAFMLSGIAREDQDVVEVDEDIDIEKVSEEVIHPLLERCRGIGETKGHDKAFEESIAGPESGLPLVSRSNSKKIVCSTKVEFGEDLGTAKTIKSLTDQRDGVPILDGNPVETPIIDAETKRTVLLLDEEDRRASRRLGSSNKPLGEVVFKPFRQGLQLRLR
jgi:hypothetical protein